MYDDNSDSQEKRSDETALNESQSGVRRRTILGLAASGGFFAATGLSSVPAITTAAGCDSGDCDLSVTKAPDSTFNFQDGGTYTITVCNEGTDPCVEPVNVADFLPQGMSFESASGTDWNVVDNGTEVIFDHPNYTALQPGECLPEIELTVSFDSDGSFPDQQVENCVGMSACDDINPDNDQDCEPVCLSRTSTFCAGTPDHFDPNSGYEYSVQSPGLQARMDNYGPQRDFDDGGTNAVFGNSFLDLVPNENYGEICEATLEVRLRPEGEADQNDRINLGFFDDGGVAWGHYIGDYNGNNGLHNGVWDNAYTGAQTFTLDLDALPAGSGTTSILDQLNDQGYLDVYIQDDTAVDYLRLTVEYCCPVEDDLTGVKYPVGHFPVGGIGTYGIDVRHEGVSNPADGVEVVDHLPEGLTFDSADGVGWSVVQEPQQTEGADGGSQTVTATYDEPVQPGERLPTLYLDVALDPDYVFEDNIVENIAHVYPLGSRAGVESAVTHHVTPR